MQEMLGVKKEVKEKVMGIDKVLKVKKKAIKVREIRKKLGVEEEVVEIELI